MRHHLALGYRKPVVVALTGIGSVVSIWLLLSIFADLPCRPCPAWGCNMNFDSLLSAAGLLDPFTLFIMVVGPLSA